MDSLNLISTSFRTEYKKTPLQLKVGSPSRVVAAPTTSVRAASPRPAPADDAERLPLAQVIDCFLVYAVLTAAVQARARGRARHRAR